MTKVAAIQMCSSHIVDENLATAEKFITEAKDNGAKLVVLPEMFAIIGMNANDRVDIKENFGSGKIQDFLSAQARKHHLWIVGGTIPIASKHANKVRAASLIFDDRGNITGCYNKIHLFDVDITATEIYRESDTIEPGNERVVVDTPFGRLGLAVCYDVRFPELFRYYFNRGVEIFILPSAFTVKTGEAHWQVLTRARAIENFSYLIGPAQGGTHSNGRKTYGHSLIVNPWGTIVAEQDNTSPGVIYAEIDLPMLYKVRKDLPVDKHQIIFSTKDE